MATLTETAQFTKKILKISVISIVSLILIRGIWKAGRAWYLAKNPPPSAPPTVSFGKLPAINFPAQDQPELTYRLSTVDQETPDLGDRATIYFMPYLKANLLALDRAKQQVAHLGFKNEPIMIDTKHYRWERVLDEQGKDRIELTMNIITGETEYQYNWQSDPSLLSSYNAPGREQTIAEAKRFLQEASMIPEDLQLGTTKVTYWQYNGNNLVKSLAPSEAHFARVDFFRKNTNDLPIMTPSANQGVVYVILSGSQITDKKVVEVSYHYFPVDYENFATYPLKSSSFAFRELQTRKGFVAEVGNNSDKIIDVSKIYLAYFDSLIPQQYLQPVYVFEDDNGFVGYVPAIEDDWTE